MGSNGRQSFVIVMMMMLVAKAAVAEALPNPECQSSCGHLSVPYPFGIREGCYMEDKFFIRCEASNSSDTTPQAFLQDTNISVLNISLDGQLRIDGWISSDCYNPWGSYFKYDYWLRSGLYNISYTRNKFMAIGCDTFAFITFEGSNYAAACISLCNEIADVDNGSCSGLGCCQAAIPRGVRDFNISLFSNNNHTDVLSFNPCSYAFVVEDGFYNFSTSDLNVTNVLRKYPMILDWTIGNKSCSEAEKDPASFACKGSSSCYQPKYGNGYLCKCHEGLHGNPYLPDGCRDIDECGLNNPCNILTSRCDNTEGSYYCSCLEGYEGNDKKNGTDCKPKADSGRTNVVQIAIGISLCSVAVIVFSAWLQLLCKKGKLIRLKEKFFIENGGLMLKELTRGEASSDTAKIFDAEELKKATNNYDESMVVGCGGYAIVYKGILEGDNMVAIKKSKNKLDQDQVKQFVNEVVVLSKIKHRNVVKLLGCCLEEEVPLLVYEFVSNGTLFDHIHDKEKAAAMSWGTRLKIAAETAGVLSYLHSSASSTPIIHRDVKTTNILLDDADTAKVSDFGASRLVPIDQTQLLTMVQGTLGYLDPEYLHTSQLTEKSDVYSFGVVLAELLTGRKALAINRPEEEKSLAKYFLSSLRRDRLFDILESYLVDEENRDQIMEVAKLAMRCLEVKGEERPSMKEVAMELERLVRLTEKHRWVNVDLNSEETERKLYDSRSYGGSSNNTSAVYDSIRSHEIILALDNGR